MATFERIWDKLYCLVFNTIYIALIPFMIWGFFAQTAGYKKDSLEPTWYDKVVAEDKAMIARAVEKLKHKELQPVEKKEEDLPPLLYTPGDDNFDIPIQQLLEGNHGRFL